MPPEIAHLASCLLLLAGLIVIVAGSVADRAKRRTRCPGGTRRQPLAALLSVVPGAAGGGCWYDLSGLVPPESEAEVRQRAPLPGVVCPECGRNWKRWGDLRRAAPHAGMIWVGRAIIAAAAGVFVVPMLTAPKWYTAAPTWMLCLAIADGDGRLRPGVASEFARPERVLRGWKWQRRYVAARVGDSLSHSLTPAEERIVSYLLFWLGPDAQPAIRGLNVALEPTNPFREKGVLLHRLIDLGGPETFDGLAATLLGDVRGMSGHAALALGRLGDTRAVPLLRAALGSANTGLETCMFSRPITAPKVDTVVIALGMFGPAARETLDDLRSLALLQPADRALVTNAAIAAIEGAEPSIGAALGKASLTPEDRPECWALEALAYLGRDAPDAVPYLTQLLEREDVAERFRGLAALSYLRESADPARADIVAILDQPDLELVALARSVLNNLSPETPTTPTRPR